MLSVTHNLLAMNAGRQFNIVNGTKAKTAEKLSSGYRINRSADDAAGLAMSEKMRRQIRGLGQASANTQDGISLCQVADGALNEVNDMLHRITELSVKAANGTNTQQDREAIQSEINQILEEIDRISDNTTFNEMKVFKGGGASGTSSSNGIQASLAAEVTADSVSGGDYQITATENGGIQLALKSANGTVSHVADFNWNEVKNTNDPSKTLADANIAAGSYNLGKNGISLSFDVAAGSTLADVAEVLNGAEFSIDKDVVTYSPVTSSDNIVKETDPGADPGAERFFAEGPYSLCADENGIWMENDAGTITTSKVTWSSMGVSPDSISGKMFKYMCPDTGYNITMSVDANASFQEVINRINSSRVTYWEAPYEKSDTRPAAWCGGSKSSFSIESYHFSEEFIDSLNMTKVQKQDVNMMCIGSGSSLSDYKMQVYATDKSWQPLSNGVIQYLDAADQTTRDFLASSTFSKGTETTLTFADASNNNFSFKVRIDQDGCTAGDVLSTLKQSNFGMGYGFGINYMSLNMPWGKVTRTNFDVSDMKWQGKAADTGDKAGFWIHCAVEAGIGMNLEIDAMSTGILGIDNLDVTTVAGAEDAMTRTKAALQSVSSNRAKIGAQQNRLEHTINNLDNIAENTTAAESQIRDADMAAEMMKFSQQNILSQAGQSILAQVQNHNQNVLSLLQ